MTNLSSTSITDPSQETFILYFLASSSKVHGSSNLCILLIRHIREMNLFISSQTGRHTWRELTSEACLGWLQDEQIFTPAHQILKSLHLGLNRIQPLVLTRRSQQHIALKAVSLRMAPAVKRWSNLPLEGQRRRWGASDWWAQLIKPHPLYDLQQLLVSFLKLKY